MRPMTIRGRVISRTFIDRMIDRLRKDDEPFNLAELAIRYGPDVRYADEARTFAARLIERLRRAGSIVRTGDAWKFAGSAVIDVKLLRAYQVLEGEGRTGGIVFAKNMVDAHDAGSKAHHDGETEGLIVERVKWADRYAPGPVPFKAKFRNGWHQDCTHCGREISDSAEYENGRPVRFDIVERPNGQIFCRTSCALGFDAEIRRLVRGKAAGVAVGEAVVRKRLGRVQFKPEQGYVEFDKVGRHTLFRRISVTFCIPGQNFGDLHMTLRRDVDGLVGPIAPRFFASPETSAAFTEYARRVKMEMAA